MDKPFRWTGEEEKRNSVKKEGDAVTIDSKTLKG